MENTPLSVFPPGAAVDEARDRESDDLSLLADRPEIDRRGVPVGGLGRDPVIGVPSYAVATHPFKQIGRAHV